MGKKSSMAGHGRSHSHFPSGPVVTSAQGGGTNPAAVLAAPAVPVPADAGANATAAAGGGGAGGEGEVELPSATSCTSSCSDRSVARPCPCPFPCLCSNASTPPLLWSTLCAAACSCQRSKPQHGSARRLSVSTRSSRVSDIFIVCVFAPARYDDMHSSFILQYELRVKIVRAHFV